MTCSVSSHSQSSPVLQYLHGKFAVTGVQRTAVWAWPSNSELASLHLGTCWQLGAQFNMSVWDCSSTHFWKNPATVCMSHPWQVVSSQQLVSTSVWTPRWLPWGWLQCHIQLMATSPICDRLYPSIAATTVHLMFSCSIIKIRVRPSTSMGRDSACATNYCRRSLLTKFQLTSTGWDNPMPGELKNKWLENFWKLSSWCQCWQLGAGLDFCRCQLKG